MNVRLQIRQNFRAMVHYADSLFTNQYHYTLDLTTVSENQNDHDIAMHRIAHMTNTALADSVMIDVQQHHQIDRYRTAGMRVTTLPAQPLDQIIGMMLYCKLNAVCEGTMTINSVSLCSDHGDHVWYLHNEDESVGPFDEEGWWHDPTPLHWHSAPSKDTVVDLKAKPEWNRLDLDWSSQSSPAQDGKVVFAMFDRGQDQ